MATSKPLPCWCGNEPTLPPWQDGVEGTNGWQSFGCYNHPIKHPKFSKTTNVISVYGENLDLDGLIDAWNDKVVRHNKEAARKSQASTSIYVKLVPVMMGEYRERLGMSRQKLAQASNVSSPNISKAESGRYIPYDCELERIAEALGVDDPADLMKKREVPDGD